MLMIKFIMLLNLAHYSLNIFRENHESHDNVQLDYWLYCSMTETEMQSSRDDCCLWVNEFCRQIIWTYK